MRRHSTRQDWHVTGRNADGFERYRITGYGSRLEALDSLPFHPDLPGQPGHPGGSRLTFTVESPPWRYEWHDGTEQTGQTSRDWVAHWLRAARSRRPFNGERIERTAEGYRIGALEVRRPAPASFPNRRLTL